MQDPRLRYQYAPPYSPQRTDPDYEKNWQRSPQYDPAPDDTLLGPFMQARATTPQQARQAEQQANVPRDRAAITEGMIYGPQQLYGQQHLLPQYQSLGNIRPLGPGEFIQHNNPVTGEPTISSEETVTVPYQGRWAVLPSLWMVNGHAMVVDEDTAAQYAQASGLNWRTFNSQGEAETWAKQREQNWYRSGGRTDTQPPLWSRPWPPQRQ